MHAPEGKCILDFDIIAFPVDNVHWITAWLDMQAHEICLVDSMDDSQVTIDIMLRLV